MSDIQNSLENYPPVIIESTYYDRLYNMATSALRHTPIVAERLLDEILRADIKKASEIPSHIVNFGSQVTYIDEISGRENTITLVWPYEANIEKQRISILTPIGVALIGLSQGASICWQTNNGEIKKLTVLRVIPASSCM